MFLFAEGALHDSAGVVDDGAPAFFEFGWLGDGAVLEVVFDVAEDPWVAECGTTNHNSGAGSFFTDADDVLCIAYVAVADDGDVEGGSGLGDDVPTGFAPIGLHFGPPVDGEGAGAFFLGDVSDFFGNDGFIVPADPNLNGDGVLGTARTTVPVTLPSLVGLRSMEEPASMQMTRSAGQPKLMSIKSGCIRSASILAASPILSGLEPKICIPIGRCSSVKSTVSQRRGLRAQGHLPGRIQSP